MVPEPGLSIVSHIRHAIPTLAASEWRLVKVVVSIEKNVEAAAIRRRKELPDSTRIAARSILGRLHHEYRLERIAT